MVACLPGMAPVQVGLHNNLSGSLEMKEQDGPLGVVYLGKDKRGEKNNNHKALSDQN